MKSRIARPVIFLLVLTAIPAWAGQWTYDNGPINGTTDAWTINYGYIVSDTFVADGYSISTIEFGVWEFWGDRLSSVRWSITNVPLGLAPPNARGLTIYGSGTASGSNLTDQFISTSQYGYDIDLITVQYLDVYVTQGQKYWLNLYNAAVPSGDPVYWDENSGKGCGGTGCPSQAFQSTVGTIPSEAFTIGCFPYCGCESCQLKPGATPEPGSMVLFGSGVLGLLGGLRHKLHL